MPLNQANVACGVRNAATRKYLTQDWLWYLPPPEMMSRLVWFANTHGEPGGRPYYSVDGVRPVTQSEWARMRHPWHHEHGLTNVWSHPPPTGAERLRGNGRRVAPRVTNPGLNATAHLNQKPLEFMRRIVGVATDPGDNVWEPFGAFALPRSLRSKPAATRSPPSDTRGSRHWRGGVWRNRPLNSCRLVSEAQ